MIKISKKQMKKITEILYEKIRIMNHHTSRLMLQYVNEVWRVLNQDVSKKKTK